MRKNVCTAYARREIVRAMLIGPVALAAGALVAAVTVSGSLLDVFLLHFAQNFACIVVILTLLFSGAYLTFFGLRGFFRLETTDIGRSIRTGLRPEEGRLTGKELLALVDRDMEQAAVFANGQVWIGREWLFLPNARGNPVVRLERIRTIKRRSAKNAKSTLNFMDQRGVGPVTRALPTAETERIQAYLSGSIPNLEA